MPTIHLSAVIKAPVDGVWRAIRDFHDMSWARGVVDICTPVGDLRFDQLGARRILNDSFHETLLALDDVERTIKYRLEDGPSPVSPAEVQSFIAVVRVHPVTDTGHAFVEWSASWEARDDAAVEFAGGIYAALLAALQKTLAG